MRAYRIPRVTNLALSLDIQGVEQDLSMIYTDIVFSDFLIHKLDLSPVIARGFMCFP